MPEQAPGYIHVVSGTFWVCTGLVTEIKLHMMHVFVFCQNIHHKLNLHVAMTANACTCACVCR